MTGRKKKPNRKLCQVAGNSKFSVSGEGDKGKAPGELKIDLAKEISLCIHNPYAKERTETE